MRGRVRHVGLILIETLVVTALYYLGDYPQLGFSGATYDFLNGQIYHELCLLLFVPALIHAAMVFRIRGVIGVSVIFSLAILPHAFLFSPYADPVFREISFTAISLLLGSIVASQVNSRERLEKEQAKLERHMSQTLEAQEMERQHLAHELHDETAQALIDISHRIDALVDGSSGSEMSKRPELDSLRADVDGVLEGTRRFIQGLRPPLLEELGLAPALRWLAEQAAEEAGFEVTVDVAGAGTRLPGITELTLFRIAQEAMANVKKHSKATTVSLNAWSSQDTVQLVIVDDGTGLVPADFGQLEKEGKFGLVGMIERARLAGGSARVQSEPGRGTSVMVVLPLAEAKGRPTPSFGKT